MQNRSMEVSDLITEEEARNGCPHISKVAAALKDDSKREKLFTPEVNAAIAVVNTAHQELKRVMTRVRSAGDFPDGRSSEDWIEEGKSQLDAAREKLYELLEKIEIAA